MSDPNAIAPKRSCAGKYDPEAYGAKCKECYLYERRQGGPVPPEINVAAPYTVIAEAPGRVEVEVGRPLVGESGQEVMRALIAKGVNRHDVSWNNAVLCRPPGNDLERLLTRMKKENKIRVAQGLKPYLSPIEACRPRFLHDLRQRPSQVIALGKTSLSAITGGHRSILDVRGMPFEGVLDGNGNYQGGFYLPHHGETLVPLKLVPTVHPAFVLRAQRWRGVFRNDIERALRWFSGTMTWRDPQIIYQPSPVQLEEFLFKSGHKALYYDVETDALEPLHAKLRCIGIGTPEMVLVAGLLSVDGYTRLYPAHEEEAVKDLFRRHFLDKSVVKLGHNQGSYDRIVIEQQLGVTPEPIIDCILLHRGVQSELPHNLAFVGSMFTDVMTAWKADHTAVDATTDFALHHYNAMDVAVGARTVQPLYSGVVARGLLPAIENHHKIQDICVGLHRTGMFIDQHRRREHDLRLKTTAATERQIMRHIIGDEDFNPNARGQVADILFNKWGLTPEVIYSSDPAAGKKLKKAFTSNGDPSTGDDVLRAMLLHVNGDQRKTAFIKSLRKFRGAVKIRGTNIIPLRPCDEPFTNDDLQINLDEAEDRARVDAEAWEDVADIRDGKGPNRQQKKLSNKKSKLLKPGLTLLDARVHPNYNSHATTSQRLSSSNPNGQNWTRKIRDIVCATATEWYVRDGGMFPREFKRALIAADMDQLELRFAAGLAKAARYLEVFELGAKLKAQGYSDKQIQAMGGDPHAVTCDMLYGTMFKNASEKDRKRLRDFGKRFSYAVLYRATVETVHETLSASENDDGELVFPWLTMKDTRMFHERWLKANPEIEKWWDADLNEFRRQGFLLEPVFGWRRDFLDGEDPNEIANFKCQAGGAAVVHKATFDIMQHIPFERWGPGTGLVQQGHDALMFEVPASHAPVVVEQNEKTKQWKVKQWCEPGCTCITAKAVDDLQRCMTVDGRPYGLDVMFTASAKAGFRWSEV